MKVPLPPGSMKDDYRRIGYAVAVEVAERGQAACQSGVDLLGGAGAERERSAPLVESNRRLLIAEQRQMVFGAA